MKMIFANSADPDEMSQCAAFSQGPHCLLKYLFRELPVNIYITVSLDETIIPCYLHFSLQNIEQSHGLDRTSMWINVYPNQ